MKFINLIVNKTIINLAHHSCLLVSSGEKVLPLPVDCSSLLFDEGVERMFFIKDVSWGLF